MFSINSALRKVTKLDQLALEFFLLGALGTSSRYPFWIDQSTVTLHFHLESGCTGGLLENFDDSAYRGRFVPVSSHQALNRDEQKLPAHEIARDPL